MRVLVGIPTAGSVSIGFTLSLTDLLTSVYTRGLPSRPNEPVRMEIAAEIGANWIANREQLARLAIDEQWTHLLFLDDDMTFEPEILDVLASRRAPIVVTNYLMKTPERDTFVAMALEGGRVATTEADTGLQPIAYSGFGVSLFETRVFKQTPQPWFAPDFLPEKSTYSTEDNPFFRRAREAGFEVLLDHDASKLVTHFGLGAWDWTDYKHTRS